MEPNSSVSWHSAHQSGAALRVHIRADQGRLTENDAEPLIAAASGGYGSAHSYERLQCPLFGRVGRLSVDTDQAGLTHPDPFALGKGDRSRTEVGAPNGGSRAFIDSQTVTRSCRFMSRAVAVSAWPVTGQAELSSVACRSSEVRARSSPAGELPQVQLVCLTGQAAVPGEESR